MQHTVDAIKKGPRSHIGNQLGRVMLEEGWAVSTVAAHLGISRMGLYNILLAKSYPKPELLAKIEALITQPE